MNGTDGFLDIHDSHLRVLDGNIHAKSIILDQLDITSSNITSSTVQFLNGVTAFKTTANVEIGTANLFVDTSTSNVGILTSTPTHTLDVRGTANVEVLRTSSNIEMNGGTFSLGGHMIPSVDNQYDIGSAENKIRDMYVSENSLWIGDKAKISFDNTEDKLTFRKRKASDTFIPAKIIDLANASGEGLDNTISITDHILAKSYTPVSLGAMKLHHWLRYAKDFQSNIKLSEIFTNTESDFDSTSTAEGTFSGTGALTVPVGTTEQQPSTGVVGMIRFNSTSNRLEVYNGTAWQGLGGISATGGTISTSGGYKIHTFTSSGTLNVINGGIFDYLVVAGGGGGGSRKAGGGGAGGAIQATNQNISTGTYSVVIGDGGTRGTRGGGNDGANGTGSSVFGIQTVGGGGGGGTNGRGGLSGGSGGGGSNYSIGGGVGGGSTVNGNDGADGTPSQATAFGGGGGGGGAGTSPNNPANGSAGNGGDGIESSISGTPTYYAGGGGGGGDARSLGSNNPYAGGEGKAGGGNGGSTAIAGINQSGEQGVGSGFTAVAGSGSGGGGGGESNDQTNGNGNPGGGSGGSGIVIIRYLL